MLAFLSGAAAQTIPVRFFYKPVIEEKPVKIKEFEGDFSDSTESRTVYQHLAAGGLPVFYSRKIRTSVCFDGKCRLLDIALYWNTTGGYLGFELPEGEFLSKTDHDPFTEAEYRKLHAILSDSLSPLADYAFEELVPGTGNPGEVDAVSSATLKDILDYIVPGAAYTTYRLWHLVHGKTAGMASRLSDSLYSGRMALALLRNGRPAEQIWALDRLSRLPVWEKELTQEVLSLMESSNLNVSSAAVTSVGGEALNGPSLQAGLLRKVAGGEYALKKSAIQKLGEAGRLEKSVAQGLIDLIPGLNGDLLGELLNVFLEKKITGAGAQRKVSEVLESSNRYTAGKAMAFLEKLSPDDKLVKKRMKAFREKALTNGK